MHLFRSILITGAVVALNFSLPARADADDTCAKMSGVEKAACMEKMGKAKGMADKDKSEMRGVGAQGKGKGAEMGKGHAKAAKDKMHKMKKDGDN